MLDLRQLHLFRLGQIVQEFVVVAERDLHGLELLEVDACIRGGDLLVDNFGLFHPLVTLRQRYQLAIGLGVPELGEGLELIRKANLGLILQRQLGQLGSGHLRSWSWGGLPFAAATSDMVDLKNIFNIIYIFLTFTEPYRCFNRCPVINKQQRTKNLQFYRWTEDHLLLIICLA